MKKFKFFALAALFGMSTSAMAQDLADGYLRYDTDGTNATITGFVASNKVAAVTIPATVADPRTDPAYAGKTYKVTTIAANAFHDETIIESVTISDTNVAAIEMGAFKGCTNLTTVTIGKKVSAINSASYTVVASPALAEIATYYEKSGAAYAKTTDTSIDAGKTYYTRGTTTLGAFDGCTKLTTVTFVARGSSDPELKMEAGTFAKTAIAKLDLTGTKLTVLNQLFENLNSKLTEVVLPATLTTIGESAFEELAALAKVDFTACTTKDFEIEANAFKGAPLIKTLILPAKLKALKAGALAGSNVQTLTINSSTTTGYPTIKEQNGALKLTTLIVKGEFKGVIGDGDQTKPAFISLTDVTFEGKVAAGAITAGAFSKCTKLANVTFEGLLAAGAVKAGAFGIDGVTGTPDVANLAGQDNVADAAGNVLTVTYAPENVTGADVASFDTKAFMAATGKEVGYFVKFVTSTWYAATTNVTNILRIHIAAALATANLKVAQNGGTYYYAKLYASKAYKIAKKQEQDVVVYGAYVDASDAAIYMENLQIIDGFYWVPANTPVIVKTKQSADVVLTEDGTSNSIKNDASGNASSKIYVPTVNSTGLTLIDAAAATNMVPYFVAPIADYGFRWSTFKEERVLKGQETANLFNPQTGVTEADFLIDCPDLPAGARLNVVWLDGSENEATAIQFVKNANVESDVIYNLAGQKVDANYKGIIIKNGKKMIQK